MAINLDDLRTCVSDYCKRYQIRITEETGELFLINDAYRPDAFYPQASKTGIYAIFGEKKELIYVGKASANSGIGSRLFSHFPYAANDKSRFEPKGGIEAWADINPTYVYCFVVENAWEAPSLEEYVISKLEPPANVIGRRRKK